MRKVLMAAGEIAFEVFMSPDNDVVFRTNLKMGDHNGKHVYSSQSQGLQCLEDHL